MPNPLWIAIQWVFILSGVSMTLAATLRGGAVAGAVGLCAALVVYCWIVFREKILENIFKEFSPFCGLIAIAFAASAARIFMGYFYFRYEKLSAIAIGFLSGRLEVDEASLGTVFLEAKLPMTIFMALSLWVAAYWLVNGFRIHALPFLRSLAGSEIAFLLSGMLISAALIYFISGRTELFLIPAQNGQTVLYDAVYTADTGVLLETDVFVNINAGENDLRHPLFGLFAMPFGIIASWITFLFNGQLQVYATVIAFEMILLLLFSLIMASRLLRLKDLDKNCFFVICFFSYPVLLYILTIEQYSIALFWLMLYLSSVCGDRAPEKGWHAICYAGAAGSLLTSGFFLPFSIGKGGLKRSILTIFQSLITFLAFVTAFGQLPILWDSVESVNRLSRFAGGNLLFEEKLWQYLDFVSHCLVAPAASASHVHSYISFQILPPEELNRIGIALLVLAVIGYLLNFRDRYCILCFCWMLFSFALLVIVGWGASENGMILYTLYFSWALLSLIFAGVKKLLANHPIVRLSIFLAAFVVMAAVNIRGLRELILFGIEYYPI
jgi:hypothetical protein